jgi:hypothetical protein
VSDTNLLAERIEEGSGPCEHCPNVATIYVGIEMDGNFPSMLDKVIGLCTPCARSLAHAIFSTTEES